MLRITINGQQVALNVRRRIPVFDWDQKRGLPLVRDPFTAEQGNRIQYPSLP